MKRDGARHGLPFGGADGKLVEPFNWRRIFGAHVVQLAIDLERLRDGVLLEDGLARFSDIQPGRDEDERDGTNQWYYVVLMEGRNREVRRLWESQGLSVSRLKRVRFGTLFIPSKIRAGQWIDLKGRDLDAVYALADLQAANTD